LFSESKPEPRFVEIDPARVRVENCRQFGGPWLALELVKKLGLHAFLKRAMPPGQEHVPWSLAKRGYSRDHRSDCKQVCIGLVVTRCGLPLGYEVFAGNRHDSTTLEEIVETMEARYGQAQRIWVLDRGMVSEDNIAFLKEGRRQYIVGTPKSRLKRFEQQLLSRDWHAIRDGLEVKLCSCPEGGAETFILCRSRDRREKEQAMHARFEKRIEEGLTKIAASCAKRRQDAVTIARRVGRLLGQNTRAAGLFDVQVRADQNGAARIEWRKIETWRAWAELSEGSYVLWKFLGQLCAKAGLGDEPRRVLAELSELRAVDVLLPTKDGREIRTRCVTQPSEHQKILLNRLGFDLPGRLHPTEL